MDTEAVVTESAAELSQVSPGTDRTALEASVAERLAEVFSDNVETPAKPEESNRGEELAVQDTDSVTTDPVVTESTDTAETVDTSEAADAELGQLSDESPTLPDAYRRSLRAYGWSDDEIDNNHKNLGSAFLQTAERIHASRNQQIAEWAAAGRAARLPLPPSSENTETPSFGSPESAISLPPRMPLVDATALKRQFGDDELIDALVTPVNATVAALNAILPALNQGIQQQQQAKLEAVQQEVGRFFGAPELAPFQSFYGDAVKGRLSSEQLQRRNSVLETADALIAGAALQGRQLSIPAALADAHGMVSSEFQAQAVRSSLRATAEARRKTVSLKPASETRATLSGPPATRVELERRTRERLAEVFGSR